MVIRENVINPWLMTLVEALPGIMSGMVLVLVLL